MLAFGGATAAYALLWQLGAENPAPLQRQRTTRVLPEQQTAAISLSMSTNSQESSPETESPTFKCSQPCEAGDATDAKISASKSGNMTNITMFHSPDHGVSETDRQQSKSSPWTTSSRSFNWNILRASSVQALLWMHITAAGTETALMQVRLG
eukprot:SAG31_NODE_319_length_17776_cov_4.703570_6_plen_153_part_00